MRLLKNTPLRPLVKMRDSDGWETSVGQAFKTVFYTGNKFAAHSADGGDSYRPVSPYDLCKSVGHRFSGDQSAIFVPAINAMVWIILADDGPVLLCVASPDELNESRGKSWTVYDLSGPVFSRAENVMFDYPQISYGDHFVYLTFNVMDTADVVVCRFPMGQLQERGTLHFQYFVAVNSPFLCPSQLSGDRGLFVVQHKTDQLRVYTWKENSNVIPGPAFVNIATIPTEDWVTPTPNGGPDWFAPGTQVGTSVQSAARSGRQLWVAWTGARRVAGQQVNTFPHPHIGIAIIDVHNMKNVQQRYLWNEEHAFAYPSLASNPNGEVAISLMWGGARHHVQHGVGFLTGRTEVQSTTADEGLEGGYHYITARMAWPDIDRFIGAGWNSPRDLTKTAGRLHQPRYVLFSR